MLHAPQPQSGTAAAAAAGAPSELSVQEALRVLQEKFATPQYKADLHLLSSGPAHFVPPAGGPISSWSAHWREVRREHYFKEVSGAPFVVGATPGQFELVVGPTGARMPVRVPVTQFYYPQLRAAADAVNAARSRMLLFWGTLAVQSDHRHAYPHLFDKRSMPFFSLAQLHSIVELLGPLETANYKFTDSWAIKRQPKRTAMLRTLDNLIEELVNKDAHGQGLNSHMNALQFAGSQQPAHAGGGTTTDAGHAPKKRKTADLNQGAPLHPSTAGHGAPAAASVATKHSPQVRGKAPQANESYMHASLGLEGAGQRQGAATAAVGSSSASHLSAPHAQSIGMLSGAGSGASSSSANPPVGTCLFRPLAEFYGRTDFKCAYSASVPKKNKNPSLCDEHDKFTVGLEQFLTPKNVALSMGAPEKIAEAGALREKVRGLLETRMRTGGALLLVGALHQQVNKKKQPVRRWIYVLCRTKAERDVATQALREHFAPHAVSDCTDGLHFKFCTTQRTLQLELPQGRQRLDKEGGMLLPLSHAAAAAVAAGAASDDYGKDEGTSRDDDNDGDEASSLGSVPEPAARQASQQQQQQLHPISVTRAPAASVQAAGEDYVPMQDTHAPPPLPTVEMNGCAAGGHFALPHARVPAAPAPCTPDAFRLQPSSFGPSCSSSDEQFGAGVYASSGAQAGSRPALALNTGVHLAQVEQLQWQQRQQQAQPQYHHHRAQPQHQLRLFTPSPPPGALLFGYLAAPDRLFSPHASGDAMGPLVSHSAEPRSSLDGAGVPLTAALISPPPLLSPHSPMFSGTEAHTTTP